MTKPDPREINIREYTYSLPDEKIAKYPLANRGDSKLLIYKNQGIQQVYFRNICDHLDEKHLLVFNNTKVIRARLNFVNDKAKEIEIFCLEPSQNIEISVAMASKGRVEWNCLVGNLKQWKEDVLMRKEGNLNFQVQVIQKFQTHVQVLFSWDPVEKSFAEVLDQMGSIPIPPYLNRSSQLSDQNNYQTVFAKEEGSVAAPTAGLHFTEPLLKKIHQKKIHTLSLTLHVGAGTFKPIKSEQLKAHEMHAEWMEVEKRFIEELLLAKGKIIIPVGTTSLRTLESLYWMGLKLHNNPHLNLSELEIKQWEVYDLEIQSYPLETCLQALLNWMHKHQLEKLVCKSQILIAPPYQLKVASGLITNFHQPASTLLLLISAVVGKAWKDIYDFALKNEFRFLSYGDASLLLK